MRSATRLSRPLVQLIERLAASQLAAADIHRLVGARAAELGVPRPSYERTRQLLADLRSDPAPPGWGEVLLDVNFRVRPVSAIEEKLTGTLPVQEDAGLDLPHSSRPRRAG
jgi:hypothetical protein